MNRKTLAAIGRHGELLLEIFPNATEKNPIELYDKLLKIEIFIAKKIMDYTNGDNGINLEKLELAKVDACAALILLLGTSKEQLKEINFYINDDPRGHALKLDEKWVKPFNDKRWKENKKLLQTDWGGEGILAPEFEE